jgi:hypothetical protein
VSPVAAFMICLLFSKRVLTRAVRSAFERRQSSALERYLGTDHLA